MPLRTSSSSLNFLFNFAELVQVAQQWVIVQYGLLLDGRSLLLVVMTFCGTLAFMFKAMRDREKGPMGESMLLTLSQRLFLGWTMIYLHADQTAFFDSPKAAGFVALGAIVCTHLLVKQLGGPSSRGLLPPRLLASFRSVWSRLFFLLPADPLEVVWLTCGYVMTRWIFPHATGSRNWLLPESARMDVAAAGGELCPYSFRGSEYDALGLCSCMDLSGLALVFAGVIWPAVEFGQQVVVRCAALYGKDDPEEAEGKKKRNAVVATAAAGTPSDADAAAPSSASASTSTKQGKKKSAKEAVRRAVAAATAATKASSSAPVAAHSHAGASSSSSSDDDSSHGHSHGPSLTKSDGVLLARTLAFTNMAAASMCVTWVYGTAMMAFAHQYRIIRPTAASSCPYPQTAAYARDVHLLSDSCAAQWSYLQSVSMFAYISAGLLSAIFGVLPNPLPPPFRIQFFVVLAMSLWKGSVLPHCQVIAEACIAAAQVDARDY